MKAIVVFSDNEGGKPHPLDRFLKPGFRHCFVIVQADNDPWIMVDSICGSPYIAICAPKDYALAKFYREEGYTVVETEQKSHSCRLPLAYANCVGVVKHVLGITNPMVLTPHQLYRTLTK